LVDKRIDATQGLARNPMARAHARQRAGPGPPVLPPTVIAGCTRMATITVDHSDNKENAAATRKETFGFHRCWWF
jgi:hypothetical protein